MAKESTMTIDENTRISAVEHVVHDWAILVGSGGLLQSEREAPINSLIQYTFLMSCRKFGDFFSNREGYDTDILSEHFLRERIDFTLPVWRGWVGPMNRQLLHLSYLRISNPRVWDGAPCGPLLEEFQNAWRRFIAALEPLFFAEFKAHVDRKKIGEYHPFL